MNTLGKEGRHNGAFHAGESLFHLSLSLSLSLSLALSSTLSLSLALSSTWLPVTAHLGSSCLLGVHDLVGSCFIRQYFSVSPAKRRRERDGQAKGEG